MAVSRKRKGWWIVASMVGVGLLAAAVAALGPGLTANGHAAPSADETPQAPAQEPREAVSVTVAQPTLRPIQRAVQIVGTFQGYDEVTVMAEASGRVVQVHHDVGDLVRPDDLLLSIDPTDYRLDLEETWRALELEATRAGLPVPVMHEFSVKSIQALRAKINAALVEFDPSQLPSVLRARDQSENAKSKFERAKQLLEEKTISKEVFEQYETEFQVAQNNLVQAKLDGRAVVAAIRHRMVLLQRAEEKLRDTEVRVPQPTPRPGMPKDIEYSIAERKVTEGEMVKDAPGASMAAFELVLDKVLKLQGTVPERYIGDVKVGQKVQIRVDAYPARTFEGILTRVSPSIDRVNRTFQIEALVPNPNRELRPGGFAKAEILTYVDRQALTVPLAAVVSFVGSTKVFTVVNGHARAVPVVPGVEGLDEQTGERWVALIGPDPKQIRADTPLVTSGLNQLADGSPVAVRKSPPAPAKAPAAEKSLPAAPPAQNG